VKQGIGGHQEKRGTSADGVGRDGFARSACLLTETALQPCGLAHSAVYHFYFGRMNPHSFQSFSHAHIW
jgi:hypothetical protein